MKTVAIEKTCIVCNITKSTSEFYPDRMKCKLCYYEIIKSYRKNDGGKTKDRDRLWRNKNKDKHRSSIKKYQSQHPDRRNCHVTANNHKRVGKIIPEPCRICSTNENIQMHHPDYNKPLLVEWLCFEHHIALHTGGVN